ncbi:hypothetical protein [Noviherbaspirillum saxi]|uniref:Death on curing protein n=1 Tax=Noviherbaspirillum saxi TaxID=2320863 RepID=A0A3A3FV55_9BURK|nr:hypothetical protein [Noviherbaspirillum saxi]RJF98438.1 hypothetical protein D3871_07905 [Noviherbaspirillum saxi]
MNLQSIDADAVVTMHAGESNTTPEYDRNRLEAALLHPLRVATTGSADVASIAVAYATGMLEQVPFANDNARAARLAMELFLARNGWSVTAPRDAWEHIATRLAEGQCSEQEFANWLRLNL